jgi:hypothetical protein
VWGDQAGRRDHEAFFMPYVHSLKRKRMPFQCQAQLSELIVTADALAYYTV